MTTIVFDLKSGHRFEVPDGKPIVATMGLLVRGEFRRFLHARGVRFTEDKGWIDSQFVIPDVDALSVAAIMEWDNRSSLREAR